jgi:hypothetical protein
LWDGLVSQVDEEGFTLLEQDPGGGARGRTNHLTRQVEVNPDLEPAQKAKTLAHELGHVLMHTPEQVPVAQLHEPNGRGRVEVEAESVAFLVSAARGLDTSSYTFPYVGGWVSNRDKLETTLRDTAARVLGTAHGILERLDRDQPDQAIPAEDRAAVAIDLGPGLGVRHEIGSSVGRGPAAEHTGMDFSRRLTSNLDGTRTALRSGNAHGYGTSPETAGVLR